MREHRQVAAIFRQVKKYLPAGSSIVVACSGGADSLALADAVEQLQKLQAYRVMVCHVEHGLRGAEAAADAAFVEAFCRERQLTCAVRHVDAKQLAASGKLSLEAAARQLRYAALWECVSQQQADFLVTAHHRDDQAETLLLHLLRGSGTDGMSGMRSEKNCLIRPFLHLGRQELELYCRQRGLAYRQDSSNTDLYFTRNKVRHLLLPLLEREFNPNVKVDLAQTASLLADDADCLKFLAEQSFLTGVKQQDGVYSCRRTWLLQLQPALRSRVVRLMWQHLAATGQLSYDQTEKILALVNAGSSNKKMPLPGATAALYSKGELFLAKATAGQENAVTNWLTQHLKSRVLGDDK